MPFYQVLCIAAHLPEFHHVKGLVKRSALHILDNGGVVRNINSWGTISLPQRMRRHKQYHSIGDYWTMHFDASPRSMQGLSRLMRQDARVVRWTILKLGEKVEDVVAVKEKTVTRPLTSRVNSSSSMESIV